MTAGALFLSRLQFVWVIGWHILLPAFTVGCASYIAVLEGLYLHKRRDLYLRLSNFWTKIFAVAFGMGVVTGIVMPFQFGTNWSRFSDAAANIVSPMLAYEGLTAFFLEAGFIGVLLLARKLVPPWVHFFAALMVALGTLFSSFWILSTNSWMQTPAGYELINGRFFPKDWVQIVFNPSFPFRLLHTVVAFYVTTAFVVLALSAHYLRRNRFVDEGRTMMKMALSLLAVLVPLQMVIGDQHGQNTLAHQPTKLAAIEAHWETGSHVPLILFALPDDKAEMNHATIQIPDLGSIILRHDPNGVVRGLKDWPRDQRPPVAVPFFAFRAMVGIAFVMLAIVLVGSWLRARGRLFTSSTFLRVCQWAAPLGFLAVLAGWATTEVGRQPWTVYGLMRTADSVSPSLTTGNVALSLAAYAIVYLFIYSFGFRQIYRMALQGPVGLGIQPALIESARPAPVKALSSSCRAETSRVGGVS